MNIGITGHQRLGDADRTKQIEDAVRTSIHEFTGTLVGISSLAVGADQLFARVMLDHGAALDVVIPFEGYERTFVTPDKRNDYFALLAAAATVTVLPRIGSDEECFFNAGRAVVERSDVLVAIWDGREARGLGGTADVVRFAKNRRIDIRWINPETNASVTIIAGQTAP